MVEATGKLRPTVSKLPQMRKAGKKLGIVRTLRTRSYVAQQKRKNQHLQGIRGIFYSWIWLRRRRLDTSSGSPCTARKDHRRWLGSGGRGRNQRPQYRLPLRQLVLPNVPSSIQGPSQVGNWESSTEPEGPRWLWWPGNHMLCSREGAEESRVMTSS